MQSGPDIDHDTLIGKIEGWNREDRGRASTAAETRGDIGGFVERTGMNAKALSMLRTIMKAADKDGGQSKAMDIIMSLKKGLAMVEAHVAGQGTADMDFDDAAPPADPKPKDDLPTGDDDFDATLDAAYPRVVK
jgi:hypothetical protein